MVGVFREADPLGNRMYTQCAHVYTRQYMNICLPASAVPWLSPHNKPIVLLLRMAQHEHGDKALSSCSWHFGFIS